LLQWFLANNQKLYDEPFTCKLTFVDDMTTFINEVKKQPIVQTKSKQLERNNKSYKSYQVMDWKYGHISNS